MPNVEKPLNSARGAAKQISSESSRAPVSRLGRGVQLVVRAGLPEIELVVAATVVVDPPRTPRASARE
jgi:hypothetical protein